MAFLASMRSGVFGMWAFRAKSTEKPLAPHGEIITFDDALALHVVNEHGAADALKITLYVARLKHTNVSLAEAEHAIAWLVNQGYLERAPVVGTIGDGFVIVREHPITYYRITEIGRSALAELIDLFQHLDMEAS